jgi:phosphonate transport system permease protein
VALMADHGKIDIEAFRRRYPAQMQATAIARFWAAALVSGLLALALFAMIRFDFSFARFGSGLGQLGAFLTLMIPPDPGTQAGVFFRALLETLAIAVLGTLIAAIIAFPLGFLAARNVLPAFLARFFVRRGMDTLRGVDTLIWALVWINVVGLGPFAGVLAIATADIGALGKLFSEAVENVDRKAGEGVTAAGASPVERVRFGILPEVLPVMASQVLYFFESNTRSATIIGIVGGGGIGVHLAENIRILEWDKVAFIVLIILAAVAVIDLISSRLRFAMTGTVRVPV